jgi:hypothetical protein
MIGKNFSCNNVGKRRRDADLYETPYSITRQLLEVEEFPKYILEPACGNGAIAMVLEECGYIVDAYDKGKDFLLETKIFPAIVTNPPYSLSFEFIQKSKLVAQEKFAFLLPLAYLHGKKRFDRIWNDLGYPLARLYVFTRYPMLGDQLREDGCYRTGMMVYAWYVWEHGHKGSPEIHWLDNNKYVIGARRK